MTTTPASLNHDLVVVLPGIMGSTLGVASDGRAARESLVWAPTAGAIWRGLRGGPRITDYPLPDGIGDAHPDDGIAPVGLMPTVHAIPGLWTPIRGYTELINFLTGLGYHTERTSWPPNLIVFPYDWRLSNRYNAQRLAERLTPALEEWRGQGGEFADTRLVLIAHSMGGLIARWYLQNLGGAEVTRKLVTLGTPWRGAAKAAVQLVNGVKPGIGPFSIDLTTFTRSLISAHQLLPEYAAIDTAHGYLNLREHALPVLDTATVADAMAFHDTLRNLESTDTAARARTHMITGVRQPSITTLKPSGDTIEGLETFYDDNDYGDATVPLTGATGIDEPMDSNLLVRIPDHHGNLQRNGFVLDQVQEILTAKPVRRRGPAHGLPLRVNVPDTTIAGEPLTVVVDIDHVSLDGQTERTRHGVVISVSDEAGRLLGAQEPTATDGHTEATFADLPPGAHTITVTNPSPAGQLNPVNATTLVWDPADQS